MQAHRYDLWSKGRNRNDVVFSFRENRNPFIDNPKWVACLFMDECDAGRGSWPFGLIDSETEPQL